jgi:2-iminobutanoate/2-iminopropanoate deaminase
MRAIALVSLIIAGSVMTFAQSGSKQTFGANPNLPFSGAVKAGGLIYVAGSIGPASGALGKDIKTQTKQTLDNISATLASAGSSMANVASMMVYLRNAGDFAAMNEVYARYVTDAPPARATIEVSALPSGAKIEIEAIALAD